MRTEHMTVSSSTPDRARYVAPPKPGGRKRPAASDVTPTLEEAKRRLAAAASRPQPWLTPEGLAMFADAPSEDLGPEVYRRPDPD